MAQTSYPKDKIKILLLENISDAAVRELKQYGYAEVERINGALSEQELMKAVKGFISSASVRKRKITKKVIDSADKLIAIGAFCIGVNQVDLKAATQKGVAVFNAPYSNTRSVAELIIGLSVMLIRKISDKNTARTSRRVDEGCDRQLRDARQDARHHRLRQHRLAGFEHG